MDRLATEATRFPDKAGLAAVQVDPAAGLGFSSAVAVGAALKEDHKASTRFGARIA